MGDRRPRRFGARHHTTRVSAPSGPHGGGPGGSHYANTLEFETVASERSVPRNHQHRANWEDTHSQFDFSQDNQSRQQLEGPHAPDKYKSSRPKASGQSISAPGSSFANSASSTSTPGVADGVLSKGFIPPKSQGDFLDNLTKMNTRANRGSGSILKAMAYSTSSSSLEITSAPPKEDISRPHTGSSGWVNTRMKQLPAKPRILLTASEKRMKLSNNTRKTPSPVVSHYSLRDRNKTTLFGISPTSTAPFSIRNSRVSRLGKRKMSSEGSASKPIALDSDSDSEPDVQSDRDIVDEVLDDTRRTTPLKKQDVKAAVIDLDDMALRAMARLNNCDVMIGLFQCIVDMFFQGDSMCMRNIRGKNETWPFEENYLFNLDKLHDIRYYCVSKEVDVSVEIDVDEPDRMEQLLDEASFMAFKLPFASEADQTAMKDFYDPTGTDVSKGYMVLRPLEDTTGGDLSQIQEHLRSFGDVQAINDKKQAKEHLEALLRDPFSYKASRQSQRSATEADAESSSESEEDDEEGSITVLTYPLPPCTSDIVTIIRRDVSRLKPRRYLNDSIIDYYFKRMMLDSYRDNKTVQEKVLFLNSHFYTRLRGGKGATALERMEAGYKNVSTWLARSNFFDRSIIFIPINKEYGAVDELWQSLWCLLDVCVPYSLHWSLAVILNPGLAGSDTINEEAFSCIAVLDPLGSYHRKAAIIRNLRAFLRMRWENSQDNVGDYGVDRVLTVNVKAPQQENSYDCGVYVLKFAEVMLKNCLELNLLDQNEGVISKDVTDGNLEALITSSAFSAEDITATRKQIRQYIEADASEYQIRRKEERAKV
ncbi:hypothetical protein L916_09921 [Phytophthora nicotianae]|uniref:Ubiquitin-like protease family profile domain-containing protein n=1 Tax=Phytophthora nicotianae TaxID=4792 RepID=W2IY87_PHYNI|nr:hypothetical protein L916_09921 [Phytophthora nicotianae]